MSDTVTLPSSSRPAPLAKKRPRLHVVYSPGQGILRAGVHSLPVGITYIGRQLSPEHEGISLDIDSSLSEEHAKIEVTDGTYEATVQDLGSKNGTWIGTHRLPKEAAMLLRDGEVLRLGSTFLVLRYEPSKSADADIATLVGVSLSIRELRDRLQRLARETAPTLLVGETGTGKELAARALHSLSRRPGEFVVRNCAALPEGLIESELFGHASHSFTDAKARPGAFRSADQGTLFLDEVGELPQSQQARLLRVIEENKITPIGSDVSLPCHVRLVTATNRDLQVAVDAGHFRQDLRARLAHLVVELPPVRSRREDILLLLAHFYSDVGRVLNVELVQKLLLCGWRDNVRGIRSIADRLRIDGDSEALHESLYAQTPRHGEIASTIVSSPPAVLAAPPPALPTSVAPPVRPYRLPVPKREILVTLLTTHLGTIANVAAALGCSRRQVQRWLVTMRLNADDYRKKPS